MNAANRVPPARGEGTAPRSVLSLPRLAAMLMAALLLPGAPVHADEGPPLTSQIVSGAFNTSTVPTPPLLSEAAAVIGFAVETEREACGVFGVPDLVRLAPGLLGIDTWFGEGENGTLARAEHDGAAVDPQELLDFLTEHEEQGSEWARVIDKTQRKCAGRFAYCIDHAGWWPQQKTVFCSVCCARGVPYALCDAEHLVAKCGCE